MTNVPDALVSQTSYLIYTPQGQAIEVDALWQPTTQIQSQTQLKNSSDSKAQGVTRVALLCHPNPLAKGTMMNKIVSTMYRFARDSNMHVVRFNFRGVGQSTGGSPDTWGDTVGEIADTLAVLEWIATQTDARELWLGGFSFGGYIACRVAQTLENPTQNPHGFILTDLALIAPSIEKYDIADLVLPIANTFCIFGDQDELVSPVALRAFVQRFGIRHREFADTGHFFHSKLVPLKQALAELSSVCAPL